MRRRASTAVEIALLTSCVLAMPSLGQRIWAQELPVISAVRITDPNTLNALQLEIFVNEASSNLIATVYQTGDDAFFIDPEQLRNVGLLPNPAAERPDGLIEISRLPDVTFRYDEPNQALYFTALETARASREIDASGREETEQDDGGNEATSKARTGAGAMVNYTLYGSSGGDEWSDFATYQGVSGAFEGRFYSALGVLSSSHVVNTSPNDLYGTTRLDTAWSYSNEKTMMSYRMGDIITGGLGWTRPTRLGGIQIQRNFGLRPDLVTMPLPELSGSAAVPSTVDVYVDNARRLSREVPAGPFSITNLPVVTGSGTARLVVRDALGRQTVSETPFYASSELLAPGLMDFSADAGFARRFYGTESNDYDERPVGSAMIRYGLTDSLTLEAHAEGGAALMNGGLGAVFGLGNFGTGALVGAMSRYDDDAGYLLAGSVETEIWGTHVFARTQRTFGAYDDIASVTNAPASSYPGDRLYSSRPPKALDQVSVSVPLPFDPTTLNFNFTQIETADGDTSRIVGVTASRPLGENGSVFASAYSDIARNDAFGIFAGLSWSFGNNLSGSTGVSSDTDGTTVTADLVKPEQQEIGSSGWRLRDVEGDRTQRGASGSYRASFGRLEAGVEQFGNTVRANAQMDGAVVFAGGDVFLSNRVDDAFAVVDAGAPGVDVLLENRPVGQTNRRGKILLPNLRAYESNRVTIDPTNLPLDATVEGTRETVVPGDRSGAVVDFAVKADSHAALVTLRDEQGQFLEAGSVGRLDGSDEEFVVGYDGEAYVAGIGPKNQLSIDQPTGGHCRAEFNYKPTADGTASVPNAVCRSQQ